MGEDGRDIRVNPQWRRALRPLPQRCHCGYTSGHSKSMKMAGDGQPKTLPRRRAAQVVCSSQPASPSPKQKEASPIQKLHTYVNILHHSFL